MEVHAPTHGAHLKRTGATRTASRSRSVLHLRPLALATTCWLGLGALALLVTASPYIQIEDSIDRAIQSVNLGFLAAAFPFFAWVGGPGATYLTVAALFVALLLNRRAGLFAALATLGGMWYWILTGLIHRPRPTIDPLIKVIEYHPGHSSFPSGHIIFITLNLGMVMLCVGSRYLAPVGRRIGWAAVAAIVLLAAISRVDLGAHWPLDVLASILVATGWLSLVASFRPVSDRAFVAAQDSTWSK